MDGQPDGEASVTPCGLFTAKELTCRFTRKNVHVIGGEIGSEKKPCAKLHGLFVRRVSVGCFLYQ